MTQHSTPFEFFTGDDALPVADINHLIDLFDQEQKWELHDSFYKASIADVTAKIDRELLRGLAAKMAEITETKLSGRVEVKIQKMDRGQYSGVHTDRPLLGFEAVRLVVQLNDGWSIERDGGALRIHEADNEERVTMKRSPIRNSCFGFVMTPKAHHSVQVTNRERRTAVFYFWHVGNTQEISDWVESQFLGISFAALPEYLSEIITHAEQHLSEEETFRAATVAWLLVQWGSDRESVISGYQSALRCHTITSSLEETLATWVYSLRHEAFDIESWRLMRQIFVERPFSNSNPSIREAVRICLECNGA